jgi:hypothetical protein
VIAARLPGRVGAQRVEIGSVGLASQEGDESRC